MQDEPSLLWFLMTLNVAFSVTYGLVRFWGILFGFRRLRRQCEGNVGLALIQGLSFLWTPPTSVALSTLGSTTLAATSLYWYSSTREASLELFHVFQAALFSFDAVEVLWLAHDQNSKHRVGFDVELELTGPSRRFRIARLRAFVALACLGIFTVVGRRYALDATASTDARRQVELFVAEAYNAAALNRTSSAQHVAGLDPLIEASAALGEVSKRSSQAFLLVLVLAYTLGLSVFLRAAMRHDPSPAPKHRHKHSDGPPFIHDDRPNLDLLAAPTSPTTCDAFRRLQAAEAGQDAEPSELDPTVALVVLAIETFSMSLVYLYRLASSPLSSIPPATDSLDTLMLASIPLSGIDMTTTLATIWISQLARTALVARLFSSSCDR